MGSEMFQTYMKLYIKHHIWDLDSISGKKGINNLLKNLDPNLNVLLSQIQKLIGLRKGHKDKGTSIDYIKEQIKLLLGEANELNTELASVAKDMILLTELQQKASSSTVGSKIKVDESDMQVLKSMIQSVDKESPNLSLLTKHFATIITMLKSFLKNRDPLLKAMYQEYKDSDTISVSSRVSEKSYLHEETKSSVTTDIAAGMGSIVKELRASQNKPFEVQDPQIDQLKRQVEELVEKIYEKEATINKLEEKLDDDITINSEAETKENHDDEEEKRLEVEPTEVETSEIKLSKDLVKLWKDIKMLKPDGFNSWLVSILQNLTSNDLKKRKKISAKRDNSEISFDIYSTFQAKIFKFWANFIKLPNILRISLSVHYLNLDDINLFWTYSFPDRVKRFEVKNKKFRSGKGDESKADQLIQELLKCWRNSTEWVWFLNCTILSSDLSKIVQSSSKCTKISFANWKIISDEPLNFIINEPYETKILNFRDTDWDIDDDKADIEILDAVSKSGLRQSLHTIKLYILCFRDDWYSNWNLENWAHKWWKHHKIDNIEIERPY